MNFLSK